MLKIITFVIKCYKFFISPILGPCCRFTPSCSEYALEAFKEYGVARGFGLTLGRLLRCHPWAKGGYDPVTNGSRERVAGRS